MSKKLFIGNLPRDITKPEIKDFFKEAGISDIQISIIYDNKTKKPEHYAFVRVSNNEDYETALNKLNGRKIRGRTLRVEEPENRKRKPKSNHKQKSISKHKKGWAK